MTYVLIYKIRLNLYIILVFGLVRWGFAVDSLSRLREAHREAAWPCTARKRICWTKQVRAAVWPLPAWKRRRWEFQPVIGFQARARLGWWRSVRCSASIGL